MAPRTRGNRGVSIAVTLLVLVVISVIALAIASAGTQTLAIANNDRAMLRARYAAEAGVADAEYMLLADASWNAGFTDKPLPTDSDMKYTVTVINNNTGARTVTAPDGTVVPAYMVYVVSTGYVARNSSGSRNPQRTIGCVLSIASGPVFPYGAFGLSSVMLGGTSAIDDSWNSSLGSYAATHTNSQSDVGTNSTNGSAITYTGGAMNYGNVYVGPGGNPSVVDGTAGQNFTGTVERLERVFTVPMPTANMVPSYNDIDILRNHSTVTITPGAYHNLTTASQCTIHLEAGTYYFSGNVLIGSQTELRLPSTGTVKIYVDGTWNSGGGSIVNPQANPESFQIYGTASCTEVILNGGNSAYYLVDAPAANVTVQGNSAVYGAIIGNNVSVQGGAQIHYDLALKAFGPTRPAIIRRAWKYQ